MYSASTSPGGGGGQGGGGGGEVTLRLREPEDIPEEVLARLEDTATLSISLQSDAVLRLGAAGTGKCPPLSLSFFFFLRVTRSFFIPHRMRIILFAEIKFRSGITRD